MKTFSFTIPQILTAIVQWPHEPFTLAELNGLLTFFLPYDNCSYEYGEDSVESFILETLSDLEIS
jgi:hypothetical protein